MGAGVGRETAGREEGGEPEVRGGGQGEGHLGIAASMGPGVHCTSADTSYNIQGDKMQVGGG